MATWVYSSGRCLNLSTRFFTALGLSLKSVCFGKPNISGCSSFFTAVVPSEEVTGTRFSLMGRYSIWRSSSKRMLQHAALKYQVARSSVSFIIILSNIYSQKKQTFVF